MADASKISFDFDGTLSTSKGQALATLKMSMGKTVYIITRRQESQSKAVYEVADKLGIPHSRVYFTNGKMKWEKVKELHIGTHYDNNPDEVKLINERTLTTGKLFKD